MRLFRCLLISFLIVSISISVLAAGAYEINGNQVSFDSVEWPGPQGCWDYANDMYALIWGVRFDSSFDGSDELGSNLLRDLSDDERLFTAENAEIFIKSSEPGAVIRITNANSEDASFLSDGLQADGTYGHCLIIAKIYDEGFIALESTASGCRDCFYTWDDFYQAWSYLSNPQTSHYRYFKYIKWPHAPVLHLGRTNQMPAWGWLFLSLLAFFFLLLAWLLIQRHRGTKTEMHSEKRELYPLYVFIVLFPFMFGGFYVWSGAIASLFLVFYLIRALQRNDCRCALSISLGVICLISIAYAICTIWAVDRGLAPFGFVKYLPLPLFLLCVMQLSDQKRTSILRAVPYSGALMTIISLVMFFIPITRYWISVDGRLAGTFQYPNTYALYMILGLLILSFTPRESLRFYHGFTGIVLLSGLLLSGSRISFLLAILVAVIRTLLLKRGRVRLLVLCVIAVICAAVLGIGWLIPQSPLGRLLRISMQSSTLQGRLLYAKDALPVIWKHPFGLGYLGYYYSQGSFQRGVYSVMNVHNEFLQLLLDIGWIPVLAFFALLGWSLIKKSVGVEQKLILVSILLHSLLDFDLQFLPIWFVLLLVLSGGISSTTIHIPSAAMLFIGGVAVGISLYFGAVSFSETNLAPAVTLSLYPYDTPALTATLLQTKSREEMDNLADRILDMDSYVSVAWSAKAEAAYGEGDIPKMILYKKQAIEQAKYSQAEYDDYFEKLKNAILSYQAQEDYESADYCISEIQKIPEMMEQVLKETDPIAWKINDQPDLKLNPEQLAFLASLTE